MHLSCRFADFETGRDKNDIDNLDGSQMTPYSYGLIFVDKENNLMHEEKYFTETGDAGIHLIKSLLDQEEKIISYSRTKKAMELTEADKIQIQTQTECSICEVPFTADDEIHNDHDHFTGCVYLCILRNIYSRE